MYFPHVLEKKIEGQPERDEYGRITSSQEEKWVELCRCRCDDNSTKEFSNDNGTVYRPSYHVVCKGRVELKEGDEVRCLLGDAIRGKGKVYNINRCNWFSRSEVWI